MNWNHLLYLMTTTMNWLTDAADYLKTTKSCVIDAEDSNYYCTGDFGLLTLTGTRVHHQSLHHSKTYHYCWLMTNEWHVSGDNLVSVAMSVDSYGEL
jgi:hypothetical protein